jgi:septum formation protein
MKLILASSSPYRRALLERLGLAFECDAPEIDESRRDGETPRDYVERLATEKARAVAARHRDAVVIGADQAAVLEGEILGKPLTHERAVRQLTAASGKRVEFLTGISVVGGHGTVRSEVVPFSVVFRQLTPQQIENYLRRDQPYDSAGSFKSEGLGIVLFEKLEGDDPTALVGLPLIRLTTMLEAAGLPIL